MKLECVRRYVNAGSGVSYDAGVIIDVDDDYGAWLMRDDPKAFRVIPVVPKEIAEPPEDKAIKAPPRSKTVRRRRKADV